MAALDACQQQPHSQQPQVDQLEETATPCITNIRRRPLPNDLVKCSTASKSNENEQKQKGPSPSLSLHQPGSSRRSGTSAAAVILARSRSLLAVLVSSTHLDLPTTETTASDEDAAREDEAQDAHGRRAAGRETAVEGDEAPRRRRPPRALSSSPLPPPSASDPPSALPPVTARRCRPCQPASEPVYRRIAPVRWLPDA
ncbi:hypothetical protein H112_02715 [Trichophyton rubrum D6]|uniref:Uncharacterized protein n=2 Tax=Trichophyton TaxID=5550 RepID=A0A022W8T2_TRIRU|nr:hypothetical protein H100_02721 [Trichophyton rubrum MR850]EZF43846.1 hypothetical protein H102_02713 [Trichophyton rubrum CBS 100081]EZF54488.1 hypothetical protein H103_02725 [Trichophyton rubrum CBS 288.86]EZF65110.1 hypothetical protein H104_02704 [Trichophyton rubrum CBS 289.86]EZF75777.1 hypothetical protein H105_02731 [Trichophyton soudanense CBS 452.61]EZF86374.1 hypothetical protein H110_02724 [Trichophyton rubrum MR1448]EZF97199.1 hypothetical protein H113_02727 [Trichophyton rub